MAARTCLLLAVALLALAAGADAKLRAGCKISSAFTGVAGAATTSTGTGTVILKELNSTAATVELSFKKIKGVTVRAAGGDDGAEDQGVRPETGESNGAPWPTSTRWGAGAGLPAPARRI